MEFTMAKKTNVSEDAKEIAQSLLSIDAVQLGSEGQFTWASGIKSPVYCDNRRVNSEVNIRRQVITAFVKLIEKEFPKVEVIAGVATGGISFGALIAEKMSKPFIYVRQEKKEHGLMKQVEGYATEGQKVVLIEDHISTGGSSMKALNGLKEANLDVLGIISIMTYGFKKAGDLFTQNKIRYYSLCDLDTALDVALKSQKINLAQRDSILKFRDSIGG